MKTPIKPNAARCAATFKCTLEQAKRLLAKNADGFRWMADRAATKGGRYNGYSETELRANAANYRAASL